MTMSYETIVISTQGPDTRKVGVITLNRPKQLNALNDQLMDELGAALKGFDADDSVGCIILTGSEKAFAAGADIGVMANYGFAEVYNNDYITRNWEQIRSIRKPVIAAVSGFALGGGCELAMMCDFIIAADNAKFGQPEIKLGVIPGAGGTQRLPRLVGRGRALHLILSGGMIDAAEAYRIGLVNEIVSADTLLARADAILHQIFSNAPVAVKFALEAVNKGLETSQAEGLVMESSFFAICAATDDKQEGTSAFLEKRAPKFAGK